MMNNEIQGEIPVIPEPVNQPPIEKKRYWGGWATAGLGAVILVVFLLVTVFVMIITMAALILFEDISLNLDAVTELLESYTGLLVSISGIVAYTAGTVLLLGFIKVKGGASIAEYLGLKRTGWKTPLIIIVVTAVFLVLVALVTGFLNVGEGDTELLVDIYNTAVWPVLLWLAVVVLAPIFEESLFRGFLFEGFRRSRIGLIGAILVTSIVWTTLHAGYSQYSLAAIFLFGLVMGIVRYRTGSLWNTILMHAFYNAVGMALTASNLGV